MKQISLLMLSAVLMLGSCSKSNDSKPKEESCKVKSMQRIDGNYDDQWIEFYTYDDKGRIRRIDYDSEISTDFLTFTYQSDKIISKYEYINDDGDKETREETYNLDANGRISNIVLPDEGSVTFKYNNEGYLSEMKVIIDNSYTSLIKTSTFTYKDGNLTKVSCLNERSGSSSTSNQNISYTSEPATESILQSTSTNWLDTYDLEVDLTYVLDYLGKGSKNLVSRVEESDTDNNITQNIIATYTYQKDDEGKITAMKEEETSRYGDEYKNTYNFTYNCE